MTAPEPDLAFFLREQALAGADEEGVWTPLAGGVSSDIWKVETSRGACCVKRALARLKVAVPWEAPIERNRYEWDYMQVASAVAPGSVPAPLAHDPKRGVLAMAWLAPDRHRLWKGELLAGRADAGFAAAVGDLVGRIHAATARDPSIPARFATDASFHALRLDAYLLETARRHPDLAPRMEALVHRTASTRRALVHGDVSPKNIMIGPTGPVLLDAEVAWFGDPAFDLAFCLNHLVIKARKVAGARRDLIASADALRRTYLARVDWEPVESLEQRAAALLPALALARVDGKSPLEYLDSGQQGALRSAARAALLRDPRSLVDASRQLLG
ncbi:phosphotransferase [Sphingosinicella terrae]|uniref:phosphotransferase n=1 Tax=Sphingosinicella terrae TaxID=2172047 RepID=UPI000E0D032B|nr:phosphotransferase [Sphingosinicella terrae]